MGSSFTFLEEALYADTNISAYYYSRLLGSPLISSIPAVLYFAQFKAAPELGDVI